MWHYTCSACGQKFWDTQRFTAEQKFREHAEEAHRPKAVLTIHQQGER
jgi:hypothetical protein